LLTYACTFECDHCFLHCSPRAQGTFTLAQVRNILEQASDLGTVKMVYFEGGEPFLYYALMLEAVRLSRQAGFEVGIVTNAYWATSADDAELWLRPLCEHGISDLSISNDTFHQGEDTPNTALMALEAARKLGLPTGSICIEKPTAVASAEDSDTKGEPVVGGDVLFKGRAAEKLVEGLPRRPSTEFTSCPYEELVRPGRVHVDCYGNVQLCQGISIGNLWEMSLAEILKSYRVEKHPICGPLAEGGPQLLARKYGIAHEDAHVDACHLCYLVRKELLDRFPEHLAPRPVYGLE
ncbi:MAG: radical SAM protein, partial [bacterium]|nr:radical SAM protein [bacterium]